MLFFIGLVLGANTWALFGVISSSPERQVRAKQRVVEKRRAAEERGGDAGRRERDTKKTSLPAVPPGGTESRPLAFFITNSSTSSSTRITAAFLTLAQSLSSYAAAVTPAGSDSGLSKRRNFQSVVELRSRRREGLGGAAELPGTRA